MLPSLVNFYRWGSWNVVDVEKLQSYQSHGGYLLPVGWRQHCLTPHPKIYFIAAFDGLKTMSKANMR